VYVAFFKNVTDTVGQGAGAVAEQGEEGFAVGNQGGGEVVKSLAFLMGMALTSGQIGGKLHHGKGLCLLQYQLGGGLTAQSQSQLHAVGEDVAEAGMVGADVTEGVLPQLADEVAKAALVEEGTTLVLGEDEAGRVGLAVDAGTEALSHASLYGVIAGQRVGVHIDLPAYTAGVAAGGGNATELSIVVGGKNG
jgi:hypothetical protein